MAAIAVVPFVLRSRGGLGQPGCAEARRAAARPGRGQPALPGGHRGVRRRPAAALQRRAFEAERRAEQIGQYTLKRKLGEGGMGEVWLAEHGLLKRPCAVKFIRPELAAHPATAARFAREVQAVTGLTHVNTVRVYDYGRADDGSFYYVMEYLDGPTLEELVRRARAAAAGPGRVPAAAAVRGAGGGARGRAGPPGPEARQRDRRRARRPAGRGEAARLRAGAGPVRRRPTTG